MAPFSKFPPPGLQVSGQTKDPEERCVLHFPETGYELGSNLGMGLWGAWI